MLPTAMRRSFAALFLATACNAALTNVTDWGYNPTDLEMQIYLPATLAPNPAVIVAVSPPDISPP